MSIKTSKNKRVLNSKSYSYLTTLAYYVSCIYNIYFYTVWFFLFSSSKTGFFGCHRNLFLHLQIFSVLLRYRIVLTEVYTSGGFVRFILEMFYIPLIIETQKNLLGKTLHSYEQLHFCNENPHVLSEHSGLINSMTRPHALLGSSRNPFPWFANKIHFPEVLGKSCQLKHPFRQVSPHWDYNWALLWV